MGIIKKKKTYKPKKENEIKLKSYIEKIKNVVWKRLQ